MEQQLPRGKSPHKTLLKLAPHLPSGSVVTLRGLRGVDIGASGTGSAALIVALGLFGLLSDSVHPLWHP